LEDGRFEVVGYFTKIPNSPNPGWIVRFKTRPERLIVVAVPRNEQYYWWWIKEVPKQ
jgi:hypothetical protein